LKLLARWLEVVALELQFVILGGGLEEAGPSNIGRVDTEQLIDLKKKWRSIRGRRHFIRFRIRSKATW
jgi:hypothetical protein